MKLSLVKVGILVIELLLIVSWNCDVRCGSIQLVDEVAEVEELFLRFYITYIDDQNLEPLSIYLWLDILDRPLSMSAVNEHDRNYGRGVRYFAEISIFSLTTYNIKYYFEAENRSDFEKTEKFLLNENIKSSIEDVFQQISEIDKRITLNEKDITDLEKLIEKEFNRITNLIEVSKDERNTQFENLGKDILEKISEQKERIDQLSESTHELETVVYHLKKMQDYLIVFAITILSAIFTLLAGIVRGKIDITITRKDKKKDFQDPSRETQE